MATKNRCHHCGWDHDDKMWSTVNRHHFLDTGRYLSCSGRTRDERGSAAEHLIAHVLLVAGVLAMTWGPLVYVLRTVELYQGVTL
jgi:hypothetical protein